MKSYQIAIVEDDRQIRGIVEAYLQKEGYRTIPLSTAEEAWELWKEDPPDMWIFGYYAARDERFRIVPPDPQRSGGSHYYGVSSG